LKNADLSLLEALQEVDGEYESITDKLDYYIEEVLAYDFYFDINFHIINSMYMLFYSNVYK